MATDKKKNPINFVLPRDNNADPESVISLKQNERPF